MILEASHLTKSFSDKLVLNDVCLQAKSGSALGLLGRNGAGKTTTIRILMQVFAPDSGAVLLDGQPFSANQVKIGYLPEERGMYPKKPILEQLIYFGKLAGLTKKQATQNADKLLNRLEMQEYRTKRLDTLSKGNQQKIQLIATLIADPDIVILDEPFSGLDPVNALLLKDLVRELIESGKIVLFSSHQMNYIEEFCDEIAILNGGKIVLSGNINEIKHSFGRRNIEIVSDKAIELSAYIQESLPQLVSNMQVQGNTIEVVCNDASNKDALFKGIESFADSIDKFAVKEPTLNEIFVKYTEAQI